MRFDYAAYFKAVMRRKLTGPGLKPAEWIFRYYKSDDKHSNVTIIDEAGIRRQHYRFIRGVRNKPLWNIGLLTYHLTYDLQANKAVRNVAYSWEKTKPIGEHVASVPPFAKAEKYPKRIKKKRINNAYVVEYDNWDKFYHPRTITETGTKRRQFEYTYYHDQKNWVIGLEQSSSLDGNTVRTAVFNTKALLQTETVYGVTKEHQYHANGELAATSWEKSNKTYQVRFSDYYRGKARLVQKPEGVTNQFDVNYMGSVTKSQDGNGNITIYKYDALNRKIYEKHPKGAATHIKWLNPRLKVTTTGGYQVREHMDAKNNILLQEKIDSYTGETIYNRYRYDKLGRKIFVSQPSYERSASSGLVTQYDVLNRPVSIKHTSAQRGTLYCYEGDCRKPPFNENIPLGGEVRIDAEGYKRVQYFDIYADPAEKLLVQTRQQIRKGRNDFVVTKVTRNAEGNVLSIQQGDVIRQFKYDVNQRLTQETHPEVGTVTYTYDEIGNRTSAQYSNNTVVDYRYDGLNRLVRVDYPDAEYAAYDYDRNDNITQLSNSQTTLEYLYDSNNRVYEETQVIGAERFETKYRYNPDHHLSHIDYPSGRRLALSPDAFGRARGLSNYTKKILYHPNGQVKRIEFANGLVKKINQNQKGLPIKIISSHQSKPVTHLNYAYDLVDNITTISDEVDKQNSLLLAYDGLRRLVLAQGPWGNGRVEYDERGNIVRKQIGSQNLEYGYNSKEQLVEITGSVNKSYNYDAFGNVISDGTTAYDFNAAQQLKEAQGSNQITYAYNGLNHRVLRTMAGENKYTVYSRRNNKLLYDKNERTGIEKDYIYLDGHLVLQLDSHGKKTYLQTDVLGSTIAATDADGDILWQELYQPYGSKYYQSPRGEDESHAYTGHLHDEVTGLTYMLARYYDPVIGRFLSVDPAPVDGDNEASFNRYAYAYNNPYKYTDPTGEIPLAVAIPAITTAYAAFEAYETYKETQSVTKALGNAGKTVAIGVAGGLAFKGVSKIAQMSRKSKHCAITVASGAGGAAAGTSVSGGDKTETLIGTSIGFGAAVTVCQMTSSSSIKDLAIAAVTAGFEDLVAQGVTIMVKEDLSLNDVNSYSPITSALGAAVGSSISSLSGSSLSGRLSSIGRSTITGIAVKEISERAMHE